MLEEAIQSYCQCCLLWTLTIKAGPGRRWDGPKLQSPLTMLWEKWPERNNRPGGIDVMS